jgi:hypothetical protein
VKFSLAGWDWKVWLTKNKGGIKTILSVALGVLGGWLSSPPLSPQLAAFAAPVFALVSRLVLDLLDYWIQDAPQ